MSESTEIPSAARAARSAPVRRFSPLGIMALSFALNFLRIGKEGFGDRYYASAVKSMLASFHNFLFASFDPGGFVTVDKPALGLWLQTLSARIFGFHGWALILPQAAAAALSVGVLYRLVRKAFGHEAGLAAAIVLALTPVSVAVARTNQLDSLLVLVLLLAAGVILAAAERGSGGLLLAGMALVGVGFNIKMLAAYTALPALAALYLFGAPLRLRTKILHLAEATVVLLVVSLSWAVFVDLTPADRRPYVDNSKNNTELELIVDWNGINRLIPQWLRRGRGGMPGGPRAGMRGGPTAATTVPPAGATVNPAAPAATASSSPTPQLKPGGFGLRAGAGPAGFGGGPGNDGGPAGVLRLFNHALGGQIGWLIVFGLVGGAAASAKLKKPRFKDPPSRMLLLMLVWFFSMAVYFSTAGFFHRYYLALIAPSVAALAGIGFSALKELSRGGGRLRWGFTFAVLVSAVVQLVLLRSYPGWRIPLAAALAACSLSSTATALCSSKSAHRRRLENAAAAIGFAGLLIAPAVWSMTPLIFGGNPSMPAAGPELAPGYSGAPPGQRGPGLGPMAGFGMRGGGFRGGGALGRPAHGVLGSTNLVKFVLAHRTSEKFLLAVPTARQAWDIILETGEPVMAMGGFMGSDHILNPEKIERMIAAGDVRYFLVRKVPETPAGGRPFGPAAGMRGGPGGGSEEQLAIERWIEKRGTTVPDEEWKEEEDLNRAKAIGPPAPRALNAPGRPFLRAIMGGGALALYDLKPAPAAPAK
jgi:4-amino-4-deoxy-L-arabinose transferase-like glycosyltransferase